MKDVLVILDPGHGQNTPGKRSPKMSDGKQLFEWEYTRAIAQATQNKLQQQNIRSVIEVPECTDIALCNRATRVNKLYADEKKHGRTAIMVSIHGNAGACGQWCNCCGWEVWTTTKKNNSDKLAQCFVEEFKKIFPDKRLRGAKEKNFTLLYKSDCPCVLTENFFYDNPEECKWMTSDDCIERVSDLHCAAIIDYIKTL